MSSTNGDSRLIFLHFRVLFKPKFIFFLRHIVEGEIILRSIEVAMPGMTYGKYQIFLKISITDK